MIYIGATFTIITIALLVYQLTKPAKVRRRFTWETPPDLIMAPGLDPGVVHVMLRAWEYYRAMGANIGVVRTQFGIEGHPMIGVEPWTVDSNLGDEGFDRLLSRRFAGEYQDRLIKQFEDLLPEKPPWLGETPRE